MNTVPKRCAISVPVAAPLCPDIAAALGKKVRAAQRQAANRRSPEPM
jgi:hypothetical protein